MFGLFAIFQDELEARISLKAFFLQLKGQLNILQNVFFHSELQSDFLSAVLGQIIVSKLTNVRKDDSMVEMQLVKAIK